MQRGRNQPGQLEQNDPWDVNISITIKSPFQRSSAVIPIFKLAIVHRFITAPYTVTIPLIRMMQRENQLNIV